MRDHAILDLLVHAGRHDLLALELILAGVGTSLHDGLARASPMPGSCASSASVALFRSACRPTPQRCPWQPPSWRWPCWWLPWPCPSGWQPCPEACYRPFFSASFFSFRADVLLSAASLILPDSESFTSVTFSRARQQFGLVGGVQRRCAECQRQRSQQAQRRSAHRGEGGFLVLLHEYLP